MSNSQPYPLNLSNNDEDIDYLEKCKILTISSIVSAA